jgi:hypothetical protein
VTRFVEVGGKVFHSCGSAILYKHIRGAEWSI